MRMHLCYGMHTQPPSVRICSSFCGLILDDSPTFHLLLQRCRQPPPCLHINVRTHAHALLHQGRVVIKRTKHREALSPFNNSFSNERTKQKGARLSTAAQPSFPSPIECVKPMLSKLLNFLTIHNAGTVT